MSRNINVLLLDPCREYQSFAEEKTKDKQLLNNFLSLKLKKISVTNDNLKILRGTSTGRLRPFVFDKGFTLRNFYRFVNDTHFPSIYWSIFPLV